VLQQVGIPAGAQPVLTVLETDAAPGPEGRIGPVPRFVPLLPGSEQTAQIDEEDEAVYGADEWYPADAPVRLGRIGALREQPFVELIFNPVLHDPVRRATTVYRSVTVRIDFGSARRQRRPRTPSPTMRTSRRCTTEGSSMRARPAASAASRAPAERDAEEMTVAAATQQGLTPLSVKYKLTVNKNAIYRLTPAWVAANAPDLLNYSPAKYRLDCLGQQLPITVVDGNSDGTLNGTDYSSSTGRR
jgi:hypothetical protein